MSVLLEKKSIDRAIKEYLRNIKEVLGEDFVKAVIYGSYARGEYGEDSDIDIAVFTNRKPEEFYLLINEISEITFEFEVAHDLIVSPVFQNISDYNRMLKVVPYFQSIAREGIELE